MSTDLIFELIGYVGSALVVISLATSSIIGVRVMNLAGALVSSLYGVLIGSTPVLVTNVVISGLDVWHYEDMGFVHLDDGGMRLTVGEV